MRYATIGVFVVVGSMLGGCQAATESSSNTVSDLGSLPKATSPVSGTSAALMSTLFTASTGVKLKEAHSTTWNSTKSRPMCEVSRIVRDTYFHAATPDMILCVISALSNNGTFGDSIYEGNYKHFKFGVSNVDTKIKFRVAKSGGAVTTFDLFMCQSDGSAYTQVGYVGQDLTNNASVTMNSVFKATVSSNTFGARSGVTGAVGKDGVWASKTLTSETSSTINSKTFTSKSTVEQHNNRLVLDAFMKGEHSNDGFTNRLYAVSQILNAGSLSDFALGDGSARYKLDFTRTGSATQAYDSTKSWTGDDRAPVSNPSSDGAYYSTVSNKTPRVSTDTVTVDFKTDEAWSCAAGEGQFSDLIFTNISSKLVTDVAACVTTYAGATRDYIDCYSATGQ